MSRDLNDDFDDDGPSLQQGSQVGHGQKAGTSYEGGGGMSFDDDYDDANPGSIELDVPPPPSSSPAAPTSSAPNVSGAPPADPSSRPSGKMAAAPQSSRNPVTSGAPPGPQSSGQHVAASVAPVVGPPPPPEPPSPAAMVAKYPPPPAKPLEAPVYFIRVLLRQFELRQDLTALRRRRSPDVKLYEAALGTYHKKTFAIGLAITSVGILVALGLFLIPVWKRFFFND